jgi:polyisoprenoid-binding protein YceI
MPNEAQSISADQLKQRLDKGPGLTLIDVLPEEHYLTEHLPTAQNACVYQVDFVDLVKSLAPSFEENLVVYGSSSKNRASAIAASKLAEAGWKNVLNFPGGTKDWRQAGYPLMGKEAGLEPSKPASRTYRANIDKSVIEWTGRNLGGKHTGTLKLSSGGITIQGETVTAGDFTMDIKSLLNTDIEDRSMASHLVQHLLSEDFFEVEKYPEGKFVISTLDTIGDATPGRPNYKVKGKLTLKGIERAIEFPAQIGMQGNESFVAQANFDIDRTEWNIIYGSGRFFECLGMHLVNDLVSIQLKIVVE